MKAFSSVVILLIITASHAEVECSLQQAAKVVDIVGRYCSLFKKFGSHGSAAIVRSSSAGVDRFSCTKTAFRKFFPRPAICPPSSCSFNSASLTEQHFRTGFQSVLFIALPSTWTNRRAFGKYLGASALQATSRGGAATKNNRDSNPKYLGVKKFNGEFIVPGDIIVRQRGMFFKAGEGVKRCGDDSLMALAAGYVCMKRENKFPWRKKISLGRVLAGYIVSVKQSREECVDWKKDEVAIVRSLARVWITRKGF